MKTTPRLLLAWLFITGTSLPLPAQAPPYTITVNSDGTFSYNGGSPNLTIQSGDVVEWTGLKRGNSIVRVDGITFASNPADVCFDTSLSAPNYVYPHKQAYNPSDDNEFTGPVRRGFSGIWALAPEGGGTSHVEIPSDEAMAINTSAVDCAELNHTSASRFSIPDPTDPGMNKLVKYKYQYTDAGTAVHRITGVIHKLCSAIAKECDQSGINCRNQVLDPTPLYPGTIPDGTYLNGVLNSTYRNPDVTGVVLRFNWSYLQYDNAGTIEYNWTQLDRELERAIRHGKYVTLDVRAGMFGTPSWIFGDYLDPASSHKASWCAAAPCAFASAPAGAGLVSAIEFLDHYDEVPPGDGCGSIVRIGAPGDVHYRALYKGFIADLASHLATDSRWFQAVAHVKVSGANLRTSEAELPHHCNDDYTNTAGHQLAPKATYGNPAGDRVLDVFKTLDGAQLKTVECRCNTQIWYEEGYTPQDLYDYYAEVENQIVLSFFGRKSLGYQLLQAGFPRADAGPGGSFLGDHLYREVLVESSVLVNPPPAAPEVTVNAGYEVEDACALPSTDAVTGLPALYENRANGGVEYCSSDLAEYSYGLDYTFLAVEPLVPDPTYPGLSAYTAAATGTTLRGARYPGSTEQAESVLAEGASGRFGNPAIPGYVDAAAGKLFVPQHSGIQPLPQERIDPVYEALGSIKCAQQLVRTAPPAVLPAGIGALGPYIAAFPIAAGTTVSGLSTTDGCPNKWIVDEGILDVGSQTPPQITGFQTTNAVRTIDAMESALFNLVYNTNAVFIELYEDVIWRAALEKGTSGDAVVPLVLSNRAPGGLCRYTTAGGVVSDELCYSKTFPEWAEELHYRRGRTSEFASSNGYVALNNPFPTTHSFTFHNGTARPKVFHFINPDKCDSATVDLTGAAITNSVGRIVVQP